MQWLTMVPASSSRLIPAQKNSQPFFRLLRLSLLVLGFLALVAVRPTWAVEHPVPLDKNVDSAKCLECHEDKTKGQGGSFRDRDGMLELSRSSGQQRHHSRQADHYDSAIALPELPRRQRRGHT